jgi:hypothetical protein
VAQIQPNRDLILRVHLRSNGTGQKGRKGGRRCDAGGNTCGGAARDSPELGVSAAPVTNPPQLQVTEHHRGSANTLRVNRSDLNDHGCGSTARGGSGRRTCWRARVPGAAGCQGLRDPAQKNQRKEGRLTKGSGWPELPRKVDVDDGRRRKWGGARGQAAAEGLGIP